MSSIMHLKLKIANQPHATETRGKKFRTQSLTMFFRASQGLWHILAF